MAALDASNLPDHRSLADMLSTKVGWSAYSNCSSPSILHFPYLGLADGLPGTPLPALALAYSLTAFTILCSRFFLPALCDVSDTFSSEVVRGTVMAGVATLPELVISVIGTFLTEEDVGASAILGSAVFNTLAVPGVCALVATQIQYVNRVDPWSMSRDSLVCGMALLFLAVFFQNDDIRWYEALSMVILYLAYLAGGEKFYGGTPEFFSSCDEITTPDEEKTDYFKIREKSWSEKTLLCVMWPLTQTMRHSIPMTRPWLALLSCSVWIAALSYLISWMITVIGYKLRLPDSLMALTVLGMGVGIPELLISVGVARKGKQTMALSSALGSNLINILLCLGVPWLIKMAVTGSPSILFNSEGLSYNCYLTLLMLFLLYVALALNNFVLDKKTGWFLLTLYGVFFVMTVLIEMNVFFIANRPLCDIKDYFND